MKIYASGANLEEKVGILRQNPNFGSTGRQTYNFVRDPKIYVFFIPH